MSIPSQEERIATFQKKIVSRKTDGVTWLDTISEYCEENSTDPEDVVTLISPWLKAQIQEECMGLRLLKVTEAEKSRIGL